MELEVTQEMPYEATQGKPEDLYPKKEE